MVAKKQQSSVVPVPAAKNNGNPAGSSKSAKKRAKRRAKAQRVGGYSNLRSQGAGGLSLKSGQLANFSNLGQFRIVEGSTPGGIRVIGKELLFSLLSGSSVVGGFGANGTAGPGNIGLIPGSFPRLGAYVPLYEWFFFHKAVFTYQSNQSTTTSGVCMLAADYDGSDAAPANTVAMMRNISSSMSNVYADNSMEINGKLARLNRYPCNFGGGLSGITAFEATVYYAFEGVVTAASTPLGYLECEYDVEFYTPA